MNTTWAAKRKTAKNNRLHAGERRARLSRMRFKKDGEQDDQDTAGRGRGKAGPVRRAGAEARGLSGGKVSGRAERPGEAGGRGL